jgi:hypothetical protein
MAGAHRHDGGAIESGAVSDDGLDAVEHHGQPFPDKAP